MNETNQNHVAEAPVDPSPRPRQRYSQEHKDRLLEEFRRSGTTARDFASLHGLKYPTFCSWVKKSRQGPAAGEAALPEGPGFILAEIGGESDGGGLVAMLPAGVRVHAGSSAEVRLLAELIKALT